MIRLAAADGFDEWRARARGLLRADVPPEEVIWTCVGDDDQPPLRFDKVEEVSSPPENDEVSHAAAVPREFVRLASTVACHRDPERWSLLYRILYRLTHGERHLLEVEVDGDVRRCQLMEKAVRRDAHKMKAFVRFREIACDGKSNFVAWHRPDHLIVGQVAPWFARRFSAMRWSILTPDASVHWDIRALSFGPGVRRSDAPTADDSLEDLWRAYYAAIFNPARLKLKAMKAEMPVRHWATLPETRELPRLIRASRAREAEMRDAPAPSASQFLPRVARTLPTLREAIKVCQGCELYRHATRAVFGEGLATARVMLVGEQPGDVEDMWGRPFVGPAGQLLDAALLAAGLDRAELYLTNAVKHFKYDRRGDLRQHRSPAGAEVAACQPWLEAEIDALQPRLIVALGATAALSLLGRKIKVTEARGHFLAHHRAESIFVTVHPSYILRVPDATRRAAEYARFVADFQQVHARVASWAGD